MKHFTPRAIGENVLVYHPPPPIEVYLFGPIIDTIDRNKREALHVVKIERATIETDAPPPDPGVWASRTGPDQLCVARETVGLTQLDYVGVWPYGNPHLTRQPSK